MGFGRLGSRSDGSGSRKPPLALANSRHWSSGQVVTIAKERVALAFEPSTFSFLCGKSFSLDI
jgi:hypothetical protein